MTVFHHLSNHIHRIKIIIQPSTKRCFNDEEYQKAGAIISENLNSSDLILGVRSATSDSAPAENLRITSDGRGLSQFTAKAWVNFNGGGTVAIRDSHNVGSITDNAVGSYSVNFTVNLADSNYSAVASSTKSGGSASDANSSLNYIGEGKSTNYVSLETYRADGTTARDSLHISVIVFGD